MKYYYYTLAGIVVLCVVIMCVFMFMDTPADSGESSDISQTESTGSDSEATSSDLEGSSSEETSSDVSQDESSEESSEEVSEESSDVDESYIIPLDATVPIFKGPSYDSSYTRIVGQDGSFTIVEETKDAQGNVWGRLKSGAGWVDLTYVRSLKPITACLADGMVLESGKYLEHIVEATQHTVKIAFRPNETLKNVKLVFLNITGDSYETGETLYTVDTLASKTPFVVGVVYYGDTTAYGISFTDSKGTTRYYAAYINGRNGALVLDEYTP